MGHTASVPSFLGRGALAGLGGTVVMTAFQKLVEMPLTGRGDSYAPAAFAEKLLPSMSTLTATGSTMSPTSPSAP